jgi:hypothetical protein
MHRHTLLVTLVIASLALGCGRRRGGPGDDDDDIAGTDGDADQDCDRVVCEEVDGSGLEQYRGIASGDWDGYAATGDVALEVSDGYAEVDLAVRASDELVFTAQSSYVDIDAFGNILGDLQGEGPEGTVYVTFEGVVGDGDGEGSWEASEAYGYGAGQGSWSAVLE